MTEFNDPHVPSPEFVASLKRELLRSNRAEVHFAPPPRLRSRTRRVLMAAGLIFAAALAMSVGLVLGASTGFASVEVLDARKREADLATMATARQLASLRLELAQANYNAVEREVAAKTATLADLRLARQEVDSMQAYVARVDIDIAARRTTAPPPRPRLAILSELPMRRALTAIACAAIAATPLPAQNPPAEPGIPVVEVGAVTARSEAAIGTVFGVRELPGGRILVNDPTKKQVVIFDAGLGTTTVVIDSVPGSARSYPLNVGRMTRWLGDSTLFSGGGQGVTVLDGNGHVARALALPLREAGNGMSFPVSPPDVVDPQGRLFSKGPTYMMGNMGDGVSRAADTVQILRADLDTRAVEPVASIRSTGIGNRNDPPINGRRVVSTIVQPVPTEDAWTVLSDGTLAIVRGQDYHVDWVFADGTKGATAKLPFDWKRLTDAEKQKMVDSAKVVLDSLMLVRNRRVGAADASGNVIPVSGMSGDGSVGGGRQGGASPPPNNDAGYQKMELVPLSQIPDFYPPVHANAAMADLDGNLWILPTTSAQSQHGELVYDVVSPKRGLFTRVRMPVGRSLVGFGKGGVLYLQSGDRKTGFHIERVKVEVK